MGAKSRLVDCVAVDLLLTGLAVFGAGCASARTVVPVAFDHRPGVSATASKLERAAVASRFEANPLTIRASAHVASEPAELFVRALIPKDARNRALTIVWWTPDGVGGSHAITLDGDRSATEHQCAITRMGAGEYMVTAILMRADGTQVRRTTMVIVTGESARMAP